MKKLFIGLSLSFVSLLSYAESDLSKKLDSVNIPSDKVTPLLSTTDLYAVNARYSSLYRRHEITVLGGNNFTADSHMENRQVGGTYRFHINDDWSIGYKYSEYENKLSGAGKKLFNDQQLLPDTDYATKSTEGFVNYNTIYGKLRLTKKQIVYFDQYIALGYGEIALANGATQMYTADLGFSFWLGKNFSTRIGLKNELYRQSKRNGPENVHNAMGYLEFGYLFGGKTI